MKPYLSIDCDFFYGTAADRSLLPHKAITEDLNAFADRLPSSSSRPILCLDHHEMLGDWDKAGDAVDLCVHFDAHSDLCADFNRAWEMPLGVRGKLVGVGDYLFHALRENVLGALIWVGPRWLDVGAEQAKLRHVLGSLLAARVQVINYADWVWRLPSPGGVCLCLSPEWSQREDLPAFCALAMRLGSTQQDCVLWEGDATRRYKALLACADPLELRFTFPYELVASRQ